MAYDGTLHTEHTNRDRMVPEVRQEYPASHRQRTRRPLPGRETPRLRSKIRSYGGQARAGRAKGFIREMNDLTYIKTEVWLRRPRMPLERYLACEIYRFSDGVIYVALRSETGWLKEMVRAA
jgi:hypothetical protein